MYWDSSGQGASFLAPQGLSPLHQTTAPNILPYSAANSPVLTQKASLCTIAAHRTQQQDYGGNQKFT